MTTPHKEQGGELQEQPRCINCGCLCGCENPTPSELRREELHDTIYEETIKKGWPCNCMSSAFKEPRRERPKMPDGAMRHDLLGIALALYAKDMNAYADTLESDLKRMSEAKGAWKKFGLAWDETDLSEGSILDEDNARLTETRAALRQLKEIE